ncbi:MAG: hypothetical protein AAF560_30850 [Acidobacteriota bacterium]
MPTRAKQKTIPGVDFVIDSEGKEKAVLIDLSHHRRLWEDIYDTLLVEDRAAEPRESLDEVAKSILGPS